jgi:hypothetical protein
MMLTVGSTEKEDIEGPRSWSVSRFRSCWQKRGWLGLLGHVHVQVQSCHGGVYCTAVAPIHTG